MDIPEQIVEPSKKHTTILYAINCYFFAVALYVLANFYCNFDFPLFFLFNLAFSLINFSFPSLPFTVLLCFDIGFCYRTIRAKGNILFGIAPIFMTLFIISMQAYCWFIFGEIVLYLKVYGSIFVTTIVISFIVHIFRKIKTNVHRDI